MSYTMSPGSPLGTPDMASMAQNFDQNALPVDQQLQAVGIPTTPTSQQQPAPQLQAPGGAMLPDGTFIPTSPTATAPGPDASAAPSAVSAAANAAVSAGKALASVNTPATPSSPAQPGQQPPQSDVEDGIFAQQQQAAATKGQQDAGNAQQQAADQSWGGALSDAQTAQDAKNAPRWDLPQAPAKPPVQQVAQQPATPSTGADGQGFVGTTNASNAKDAQVDGYNYGNIRPPGGQGFQSYATAQDGVAAMSNQLDIYGQQHGVTTVRQAITRWLGGTSGDPTVAHTQANADKGNDVDAYVANVTKWSGLDPDAKVDLSDPAVQAKLIPAMMQQEHGQGTAVSPQTLQAGISQGLMGKAPQLASSGSPSTAPATSAQGRLAQVGAEPSGPVSSEWAPSQANSITDQLKAIGVDPKQMMGNPWFAMAAGLMGKRSFGEGMSAAFSNLNQLQQQRGDLAFKLASMQNEAGYRNANLQVEGKRLDAMVGNQQMQRVQAQERIDQGQQRVNQGQQRADFTTAGGAAAIKDNMAESDEIEREGIEASKQLGTYQNWKALADSGKANVGPGVLEDMKRRIATAFPSLAPSIGANTSGQQLADMMGKLWQQDNVSAMKGTGLRTQREFEVFQKSAPSMSTDPAAASAAAGAMLNSANADAQAYQDWVKMDPQQKDTLMHTMKGVSNFRNQYLAPAASANAKGTVAVDKDGQPSQQNVIRYDAQGNRIQ